MIKGFGIKLALLCYFIKKILLIPEYTPTDGFKLSEDLGDDTG
jgi:hypothetical protein